MSNPIDNIKIANLMKKTKMKIYVYDMGVYGSIVVTAETRKEAFAIMRKEDEFVNEKMIVEYELKGFVHHNMGDQ